MDVSGVVYEDPPADDVPVLSEDEVLDLSGVSEESDFDSDDEFDGNATDLISPSGQIWSLDSQRSRTGRLYLQLMYFVNHKDLEEYQGIHRITLSSQAT